MGLASFMTKPKPSIPLEQLAAGVEVVKIGNSIVIQRKTKTTPKQTNLKR